MRAPCRVCRVEHAVTRRGRVWLHTARPLSCPCPGARLPPWGAHSDAEPLPLPGQDLAPSPIVREYPGGTVYLLHFASPFRHARHYLGWAGPGNLAPRLAHHNAGTGANLLRHVSAAGIPWTLARTWPGDRRRERQLKARGLTRCCPLCRPELVVWLTVRHTRRPLVAPGHSVCA